MANNPIQNVQQARVVTGTAIRPGQIPVQLELFDAEGNPWSPEGGEPVDTSNFVTREEYEGVLARLDALEDTEE